MPLHHIVIAGAFKLLGYGVVQARLVGIVYAIATIFLTYGLARRLYGVPRPSSPWGCCCSCA